LGELEKGVKKKRNNSRRVWHGEFRGRRGANLKLQKKRSPPRGKKLPKKLKKGPKREKKS